MTITATTIIIIIILAWHLNSTKDLRIKTFIKLFILQNQGRAFKYQLYNLL